MSYYESRIEVIVSRINLEDNLAKRVRHSSSLYSSAQAVLFGIYKISGSGPTYHFLDANSVDRQVYLPPIEPGGGQFYVIMNISTIGRLQISNAEGVILRNTDPNSATLCLSNQGGWFIVPLSSSGSSGVVSTVGAVDPSKLASFADSTGLTIRGISPGTGMVIASNQLVLDPDLVSLATATGLGTSGLYYRKADGVWTTLNLGTNLTIDTGSDTINAQSGVGDVTGPPTSVNAHIATFFGTTGKILQDSGKSINDLQPLDADLTSLANAANFGGQGLYYRRAPDTWVTLNIGTNLALDVANNTLNATPSGGGTGGGDVTGPPSSVTGRIATFANTTGKQIQDSGVMIGQLQPADPDLSAIAALTGTNTIYYRSGPDTWSPVTFSGLTFSGGVLTATAAGAGDVVGPASSVTGNLPLFSNTSGKLIGDSGIAAAGLAPLLSPTFTGDPKAPTPVTSDNDTSIATTAFVKAVVAGVPGVTDGDKGDITVSSGGATWTIDTNVVTYAKMQDISTTGMLLGRKTAGPGDPEEVSISQALDLGPGMSGVPAQGDVYIRGAASWTRLAAGASGQVLQTQGVGANPIWATVGGGSATVAFSASASADQTGIATETGTKVNFATANFNDGGLYNTSLSRWTPPAGRCQLMASVQVSGVLLGTPVILRLFKNGALFRGVIGAAMHTSISGASISTIDACSGTDFYEVNVVLYTASTGTVVNSSVTYFQGLTL